MSTEETTPVPNVIDRYEDEKPCDSRSWSCDNPEHGRHRLFDAKRRDGWMTYMRNGEMRARVTTSVSGWARLTIHWDNPNSLESTGVTWEIRS